jgi:putative phage-type endonuclease
MIYFEHCTNDFSTVQNEICVINDNDLKEQIEISLEYMKDNMDLLSYSDYKFDTYMKTFILDNINTNLDTTIDEEYFDKVYDENIEILCQKTNFILRSYKTLEFNNENYHSKKLEYLRNVKQPEQKSEEWYIFRQQHITGSNAWKIFGTQSSKNNLMYEKLQPREDCVIRNSLSESPLNWGHKYEPLTIVFYEYFNDVKVEEYGCIPHKTIPFLAASPDGIVTSKKNNGRMVEIKNVVSREITQIPKMEYYIQMQIQMEVCDLDECDFVETKFVEYEDYESFKNDKYNIKKGMIIIMIEDNSRFVYSYSPLFKNSQQELDEFTNKTYEKYNINNDKNENSKYTWFKNVYWKLDIYSCVYVPRNKKWFKEVYPQLESFWENVKKEQENNETDVHLKYKSKPRHKPKGQLDTDVVKKPLINNFIDLSE